MMFNSPFLTLDSNIFSQAPKKLKPCGAPMKRRTSLNRVK